MLKPPTWIHQHDPNSSNQRNQVSLQPWFLLGSNLRATHLCSSPRILACSIWAYGSLRSPWPAEIQPCSRLRNQPHAKERQLRLTNLRLMWWPVRQHDDRRSIQAPPWWPRERQLRYDEWHPCSSQRYVRRGNPATHRGHHSQGQDPIQELRQILQWSTRGDPTNNRELT